LSVRNLWRCRSFSMPVKLGSSDLSFNHSSVAYLSSSSVENLCPRGVASNLETDGNHSVPDQENMVGDAFLQIRIQV